MYNTTMYKTTMYKTTMYINSRGGSILQRCPDKMGAELYQQEVLKEVKSFICSTSMGRATTAHAFFMQDGAKPHTAASTLKWLCDNDVKLLPDWPAQSPDLNPVETCWTFITWQLIGRCFPNKDSIWEAVCEAWAKVPADVIKGLYENMWKRTQAVREARGGNTKY